MSRLVAIRVTLALAWMPLACQTAEQAQDDVRDAPASYAELRRTLLGDGADVDTFGADGPLAFDEHENLPLHLPTGEQLIADLIVPQSASSTPLVIIAHGNHSHKEAHRYQARRLATFGFEVLVLQLPNTHVWIHNGHTIEHLVRFLHREPETLPGDIDPNNIVLVGHSFGGSAVTIAAGRGAPVKGVILLDPAVVNSQVKKYMRRVATPVVLLGADREVFRARRRSLFFQLVHSEIGEISVRGATHDDAQNPSMFSLSAFGFDPFTSPEKQATFTTALTTAAFSLAATGGLDYAWSAFGELVEDGVLKNARRRGARD